MKISFRYKDRTLHTSPTFGAPPEQIIEEFWDEFLDGSEDQEDELFWNCDVSGDDDEIIVQWFEKPSDPQRMVDKLSLGLKAPIPPFAMWIESEEAA